MRTMCIKEANEGIGNKVEKNKASHHEKPYLWYIQIQ